MVPIAVLLIPQDHRIILGMDTDDPICLVYGAHYPQYLGIIVHEDVSCCGTHEELETADHRCQGKRITSGTQSCEKSVVHVSLGGDFRFLILESSDIGDRRYRIRHIQYACVTSEQGGYSSGPEVLLLCQSRIPEMHMRIRETR